MSTILFDYSIRTAGLTDIGKRRKSNQDEVILAPEVGFFGVSDGMGGLQEGAAASAYVRKAMPLLLETCVGEWRTQKPAPASVGKDLENLVQMLSDRLFMQGNTEKYFRFGATLAGVLLYREHAIFVCLGDSRGYLLRKYKRKPEQITQDMNAAGLLVRNGEMTREEALTSPASSRLYAFVGMSAPACPEIFVEEIRPGDRILLCSDGLYGMVPEREIARILRSSRNPDRVCERLIKAANRYGGRDNISAAYIRVY
ncbi:MAG: SpoIIE family protein phosphatase [Eubacteriales bacterium]|nr:SpoIIE family protein phosphatase [Eubacteriales bacterium]